MFLQVIIGRYIIPDLAHKVPGQVSLCQCAQVLTAVLLSCSGLEEVLGVQLPKDLSSDEARDTLAKLVSY